MSGRYAQYLSQEFLKRLPIVGFPTRRQVFPQAPGETGMVKNDLGPGALLREHELRNRVNARIPATHAPCLYDSLVGHEFDVPSRDVPAEERKRASHFTTDLRGLGESRGEAGLHHFTELYDLVELFGVGERFVDALSVRFESNFLVNGFRRTRNLLLGPCPSLS